MILVDAGMHYFNYENSISQVFNLLAYRGFKVACHNIHTSIYACTLHTEQIWRVFLLFPFKACVEPMYTLPLTFHTGVHKDNV